MIFAQDSTLTGDLNCDNIVDGLDAEILQNLIFQIQDVTELAEEYPCFNDNVNGLTAEQLQELINMIEEEVSINYSAVRSNNYPEMISAISSETMTFGNALIYCADLEEDGHSDWFLPNLDQLAYAISGGCELPDNRTDSQLWTTSKSHTYDNEVVTLNESGGLESEYHSNNYKCRCARFEDGETSASSSSSSVSSSSIENNSEQAITMIGPMYIPEEFLDFLSVFELNTNGNSHQMYYYDAIRFCAQLEYSGFNDWFLPSLSQLSNYYVNNASVGVVIPNFTYGEEEFWTRANNMNIGSDIYTVKIKSSDSSLPNQMSNIILDSSGTANYCFCVR